MSKPRKFIRKQEVCERVGLAPVTVWRKANDPKDDFPAPRILGANSTGFFEDEIDAWIESRPRGGGERKPHLAAHYGRGAKSADTADKASVSHASE